MALCSLISMLVVLLASVLLLTVGQTMTSDSEPYVVTIHKGSPGMKTAVCTGAIIKPRHILTTASCIDRAGNDIFVSTAAHASNQAASVGEDFHEVHKYFKHPNFNNETNMVDLAVIKLKSDIQAITDMVSPLFVTNVGPINESSCTATHWRTQFPYTQLIRTGKLTPCADADRPTQICASFTEYEECAQSDAEGGVLACSGKVVGIFSGKIGSRNCTKRQVRFVDVTKRYNWINLPEALMPMPTMPKSRTMAKSATQQHSAYRVAVLIAVLSAFSSRL